MKQGSTLFLKITISIIGIAIICLSVFILPWLANNTAKMYPEYAYLQYPVLIWLYMTVIPFFIALYHAFRLLNYIDCNNAFSATSVTALTRIKNCAIIISMLYIIGTLLLLWLNVLHPGIAIIVFIVIFASIVLAVFTAVLRKLLIGALHMKLENDLTI